MRACRFLLTCGSVDWSSRKSLRADAEYEGRKGIQVELASVRVVAFFCADLRVCHSLSLAARGVISSAEPSFGRKKKEEITSL